MKNEPSVEYIVMSVPLSPRCWRIWCRLLLKWRKKTWKKNWMDLKFS